MSGTISETSSIPTIATITMDADKEDGSHREGPVVANANNTSPSISTTPDDDHTNAEIGTSLTTTTPLPQPTTAISTTNDVLPATENITSHHHSTTAAASNTSTTTTTTPQRVPYKYDPDKITLRFLFANRDGLTVTVTCNPSDTIGEVKGALISIWPKDVPNCEDGDDLRLICMGKGFLSPDSRTLQDCQIPIFKTHPTPVNVSVKPSPNKIDPANESSNNPKTNKRNQQQPSNASTNSNSIMSNHHHNNVNNNNNNSSNNANGSHNNPRATASTTNRTSTHPNGSPIETGQGCCIIS